MKITLSLPATLLQEADTAAKSLGVSRSKIVAIGLEYLLKRQRADAKYGNGLREESEAWPVFGRERSHRAKRQGQNKKMKKLSLSLSSDLTDKATAAAEHLRMSRSELFRAAIETFLGQERETALKMAINRYAAGQGDLSEEDEILLEHARQMMRRLEWNE